MELLEIFPDQFPLHFLASPANTTHKATRQREWLGKSNQWENVSREFRARRGSTGVCFVCSVCGIQFWAPLPIRGVIFPPARPPFLHNFPINLIQHFLISLPFLVPSMMWKPNTNRFSPSYHLFRFWWRQPRNISTTRRLWKLSFPSTASFGFTIFAFGWGLHDKLLMMSFTRR